MAFAFCVAYAGLCSTSDPRQPTHFLPKVCYSHAPHPAFMHSVICNQMCHLSFLISELSLFRSQYPHFVQIILNCTFYLTHIHAVSQVLTAAISLQVLQTSILTTCSLPIFKITIQIFPSRNWKLLLLVFCWTKDKINICQIKEILKCNTNITGILVSFGIETNKPQKNLTLQDA